MALTDNIPSFAPDVLSENLKVCDSIVNGLEKSVLNRPAPNGLIQNRTFYGMNAQFYDVLDPAQDKINASLISMGFIDLGVFAAGIEITQANQVLSYNGAFYRTLEALPYTTTSTTPDTDAGEWVEAYLEAEKMPVPIVDLPFTQDVEGVHAGAFDFARSTTTGNINKSGVVETLAIDEPAISLEGLSVYESYTNLIKYSEDFSNAAWALSNIDAPTQDGTIGPDGLTQAWKISRTIIGNTALFTQTVGPITNGIAYLSSYYIKGSAGETLKVEARALDNSVVSQVLHVLSGEWELLSTYHSDIDWSEFTGDYINTRIRFDIVNTAETIYVATAQFITGLIEKPYIKTEAAEVTRAADIASIPVMNNMPAAGQPFTIAANITSINIILGYVVRMDSFAFYNQSTYWRIEVSDGVNSEVINTFTQKGSDPELITLVYDVSALYLYVNGFVVWTGKGSVVDIGKLYYSLTGELEIGSNGSFRQINGEMRNFKIYHKALTPAEIYRLGSA